MCRAIHMLMTLVVLAVLLCLISTEDHVTTEQYLRAYYDAKRFVRRAGMSNDGERGGRCSQWRGARRGHGRRGGFRRRGFDDGYDREDFFPGWNGTFVTGNRTIVIGNDTVIFANGTLTFPNGTQIVVDDKIFPVNGQSVQLLSFNNLAVAENGLILAETTRIIRNAVSGANVDPVNVTNNIQIPRQIIQDCTLAANTECVRNYPYRTADGTCNNLRTPLLGSSSTPMGRYLPAEYSDGIDLPRVNGISGTPLPGARLISTTLHGLSTPEDRDDGLTHLTPIFGLFLSTDVANFPTFPTEDDVQESLDCCTAEDTAICYPIEIPENDTYFSQFEKRCMPYVRSLAAPLLNCALGSRQQLNLATSYIDVSQIYGSNAETQAELRTMSGGRLKTQETESFDLLPTDNSTYCTTDGNLCFLSGDRRVNNEPMTMALHNLFFREHNRIADALSAVHPNWTDEILFQEARRIVVAEMQHIAYGEYLPKVLGDDYMERYSLKPLQNGTAQYSRNVNPNTRNGFAAAGVFHSHSGIRSTVTIGNIEYPLSSIFFNPDVFYEGSEAPTAILQGLINDLSQMIDRLMSDEITNKLAETTPGNGWDQAALDIQTGRDHGLPTYVAWRQWCGLSVPENFTDLIDHSNEAQNLLEQIYMDVQDIDLWSGAVSETNVDGGRVGPTFACIIGIQAQELKTGDRFWYENRGRFLFSPDELECIRNVSLSRIICDNTNIQEIQTDPFLQVSDTNPLVACDDIRPVDFCPFVREWSDWSSWTDCLDNISTSNRTCTGPVEGTCSCTDDVIEIRTRPCNWNTTGIPA